MDRLVPSVISQGIEILIALRCLLDCTQRSEIVDAGVSAWALRLIHHLLSDLVLTTCAASYVVFALIVVDGAEILWARHSTRTLGCS